jgi:SAM-dependent methyltransferase
MNPKSLEPYGAALLAYFQSDPGAQVLVRRDDGQEAPLPISYFFRDPSQFTSIERAALERCTGHVLDAGAGTGLHSLVLQQRGLQVTAIDIIPAAVEIMARRGVKDARCADLFDFEDKRFDTILMTGHGIGLVETIAGLDRFLTHAHKLLSEEGRILLDSLDVRVTNDPLNLAYHRSNQQAGRYIGEIRMQFEFQGQQGPFCDWLHIDAATLKKHAVNAGWKCEVVIAEDNGNYLAQLTKEDLR